MRLVPQLSTSTTTYNIVQDNDTSSQSKRRVVSNSHRARYALTRNVCSGRVVSFDTQSLMCYTPTRVRHRILRRRHLSSPSALALSSEKYFPLSIVYFASADLEGWVLATLSFVRFASTRSTRLTCVRLNN